MLDVHRLRARWRRRCTTTRSDEHDVEACLARGARSDGHLKRAERPGLVGELDAPALAERTVSLRREDATEQVTQGLLRRLGDGEALLGPPLKHARQPIRTEAKLGRLLLDHDAEDAVDRCHETPKTVTEEPLGIIPLNWEDESLLLSDLGSALSHDEKARAVETLRRAIAAFEEFLAKPAAPGHEEQFRRAREAMRELNDTITFLSHEASRVAP